MIGSENERPGETETESPQCIYRAGLPPACLCEAAVPSHQRGRKVFV
jgi:hypothetical protein